MPENSTTTNKQSISRREAIEFALRVKSDLDDAEAHEKGDPAVVIQFVRDAQEEVRNFLAEIIDSYTREEIAEAMLGRVVREEAPE